MAKKRKLLTDGQIKKNGQKTQTINRRTNKKMVKKRKLLTDGQIKKMTKNANY